MQKWDFFQVGYPGLLWIPQLECLGFSFRIFSIVNQNFVINQLKPAFQAGLF